MSKSGDEQQRVEENLQTNERRLLQSLSEAVTIKSVSTRSNLRQNVFHMAEWIRNFLASQTSAKVWLEPNVAGMQTFPDGATAPYPPFVFAELGNDPAKKTVLVYAHYDVQPAEREDGWETDPWQLVEVGSALRGRGSTDDKGPLIGWLEVLRSFRETNVELPINLRLVFEGMEESGSEGFDETMEQHKARNPSWWSGCDYCVISDNYWLGTQKPCLSYGLRGITCVEVEISGPGSDLHSGIHSGAVFQPMDDLLYILSNLKCHRTGDCIIPNICDEVQPVTPEEMEMYKNISFDPAAYCNEVGAASLPYTDKAKVLMNRWRFPALSIHGIEGAYSEPGFKTVIPRRVVGKFSIRIVPNQTAEHVERCIKTYLEKLMNERRARKETSCVMKLTFESGAWFYVDPSKSPVFRAAHSAIQAVWKVDPDYTREGGSIPVAGSLSKLTDGKDVCLLPMGRSDDGAHSQNEKIDRQNLVLGAKVFANFLYQLARI